MSQCGNESKYPSGSRNMTMSGSTINAWRPVSNTSSAMSHFANAIRLYAGLRNVLWLEEKALRMLLESYSAMGTPPPADSARCCSSLSALYAVSSSGT